MENAPALPKHATFEMTYACNHACLFCYCPWHVNPLMYNREMSIGGWKEAARELVEKGGVDRITLSGGEPLLKDGLRELIIFLQTLAAPPQVELYTNGALLTDEWLDFLAIRRVRLALSLPALRAMPRLTGSFTTGRDILALIERATRRGIETVVGITATALAFSKLRRITASAFLAGATAAQIVPVMNAGRGRFNPSLYLTPKQVAALPKIAAGLSRLFKKKVSTGNETACECLSGGTYRWKESCPAGKGFFVVSPAGWLRPCFYSEHDFLHWREWPRFSEIRENQRSALAFPPENA